MSLLSLLRRFTIRFRMNGAIAMVLLLFTLVGGAGLQGGLTLSRLNSDFMHHSLKEVQNISDIRHALGAVRQNEKNMVIDYENAQAVAKHREAWVIDLKRAGDGFAKLLEGEEDEDNPIARDSIKQLESYKVATSRVLEQIQAGAYDNARVADRMLARAKEHAQTAEKNLERIAQIVDNESAATRAEFEAAMSRTIWTFGGLIAMAIVLVVPLTLVNARSITLPMAQATHLANAIAAGDLSTDVVIEGNDEATELMQSLRQMQQSLVGLVRDMGRAASTIETAGNDIASGNHNLSQRTDQAATNLKQTARSIEQLTSAVRQSAASASTANQLASEAAEVAHRGGDAVGQVVTMMGEIDAASQKISSIIGVIDDIAFQTNILALNAAVEAARAGEQGRGFAVVASEVRSLAQRSADAAGEIKSLIVTSVEKVEHGGRQAQRAGQTIQELVVSVQKVSDIIGEVTAAASEQSAGIVQVNAAVNDLDRMTQQNATLVQDSASAADGLCSQAATLSVRVSRFRLEADKFASEPAPATPTILDATRNLPTLTEVAEPAAVEAAAPAPKASPPPRKPAARAKPAAPQAHAPAPAAAAREPVAQLDEWETF
jgi:methyl-accepting chemotaxis protein